jgi:hypothetical protein
MNACIMQACSVGGQSSGLGGMVPVELMVRVLKRCPLLPSHPTPFKVVLQGSFVGGRAHCQRLVAWHNPRTALESVRRDGIHGVKRAPCTGDVRLGLPYAHGLAVRCCSREVIRCHPIRSYTRPACSVRVRIRIRVRVRVRVSVWGRVRGRA